MNAKLCNSVMLPVLSVCTGLHAHGYALAGRLVGREESLVHCSREHHWTLGQRPGSSYRFRQLQGNASLPNSNQFLVFNLISLLQYRIALRLAFPATATYVKPSPLAHDDCARILSYHTSRCYPF